VSGDSNVKIAQSPSFNVLKNSTWASVKVKANQKISFSDGFILKSWHLANKDGKLLVDTEVLSENTTVFAVSQKENIPEEPEKPVKDEDGNEIKEEIIGEEGKDKEVKAIIEVVEVKEEGKEKPTTKLKISGNILSDETKRIADILRSQVYEYKNKKDELKTIQFDALSNNSTLNIQFKDESKKINVEDLKILVAKIPNQVKIDNEECITLDKSANITSIKGTVSLKNIVKGANSNSELTKWEFVSDKINTAETSVNSATLNITSTEKDAFTKENLKIVASKLTETNITNKTINGTQKISINKNGSIKTISGEVSLKDVIEAKDEINTGLTNYVLHSLKETKDPTFKSENLKINTFYKTAKAGHSGTSISLLNINEVDYTPVSVTLDFLKNMQQTALNETYFNYQEGNKIIGVKLGDENSDIEEFYNEMKNNEKFKEILKFPADAIKDTDITLTGEREKKLKGKWDVTPYPRVEKLLKIIENPTLKGKVKVGKMKLRGNIKDLLPHLLLDNNIEKEYGNITFPGYKETDCTGPDWVGYDGRISDTEREILKGNEFLELSKRTNEGQTYIRNAIIQNLNLQEELVVDQANWANVTFENSNLSKMSVLGMIANATTLEFKNTTLPYNMKETGIGHLILKDVKFPKERYGEINEPKNSGKIALKYLPHLIPNIHSSLEIYGKIEDSPLDGKSSEDLIKLIPQKEMPYRYKGPKEIYEKLKKYFFKDEASEKEFTDLTGSLNIHKPQDQLLAILKKRQERSHS